MDVGQILALLCVAALIVVFIRLLVDLFGGS
jgi:hypothetical protein